MSAVLIATLTVTSCRHWEPVRVPFPDDPRVLHGQWRMEVLARTSDAPDGADSPLPFDYADLNLIATSPSRERTVRYTFSGSFDTPAEHLEISGEVSGGGIHEYRPVQGVVVATSVPPAPVNGSARITDPLTGDVRYELVFIEPTATGTVFRGHLTDATDASEYLIELQRAPR